MILTKPANAVAIGRATGSQTLGLNGGTLFGIPVVTSNSVGDRLIALDTSQILIADDGGLDVYMSESARQTDCPSLTRTSYTATVRPNHGCPG